MLLKILLGLSLAVATEDSRNHEIPHVNTHFQTSPSLSLDVWSPRKRQLQSQILHAAGLPSLNRKRPPPAFTVSRRLDCHDYRIWTILIETLPGFFVGADLYLPPASKKGPYPAVLSPHGHWDQGRRTHLPEYSVPSLGINLAAQGYAALAWDMVGYGDSTQLPHDFITRQRQLWGFTPLGLQLHNSIRMLDFLENLPNVNPSLIGITGASGGGTQSFLLAAIDQRIRVSAPVNMVSSYMQGGDPCEEAPGLRFGTSNTEFAAMMAPRPMLLVSSSGDWTKHTPNEEYLWIRQIYSLYGAQSNLENAHFQAKHNFNQASRQAVYVFLTKHLNPQAKPIEHIPFAVITQRHAQDLLKPSAQPLPARALSIDSLDQAFHNQVLPPPNSKAQLARRRSQLRLSLGVSLPGPVREERVQDRLFLHRLNRPQTLTAILQEAEGPIVVLIDPRGALIASQSAKAIELRRRGYTVLALQPFEPSRERYLHQRADRWFNSYNPEPTGAQVDDILTALEYARQRNARNPSLIGIGKAAVWATLAAATASGPVDLIQPSHPIPLSPKQWEEDYFVPGILRLGGWTLVECLASWN